MGVVRNIVGTIVGIVTAQLVVRATTAAGEAAYPPPANLGDFDEAQLAVWMAGVPLTLKLLVLLGWAVAAIAGPWLALRITDRRWSGWVVTIVFLAACVADLTMLPHPLWMTLVGAGLPLAGGWAAQRLHRAPYPGEPLLG